MSLWPQWEALVARDAARPLVREPGEDGRWATAGELHERACALAGGWQARALRGRIVLFSMRNGAEWLATFLALQRLGAVAAAADPGATPDDLRRLAEATGAAFVMIDGSPQALAHRAPLRSGACLAKITSGSTGQPRALPFRAAQMLADGRNIIRTMGIRAGDVNFGIVPIGHSYGLGNLLMPLLMQGTAIAACETPLPRLAAAGIAAAGATVLPSVPAFFRALAETDVDPASLRTLRLAISAGSPLPPAVAQAFEVRFGLRIHNFLGSSETGGIAYDRSGAASLDGSSVGTAMDGVTLSAGPRGRLRVSSDAVARPRKPSTDGPASWLLHDIGRIDAAGNLALVGRARPLAKIGGRRVDPLEVEAALKGLPGVTDALVVVTPAATGDRLAALVESATGATAVRSALTAVLPAWKIPRRLVVLETFPRDARGKLKRAEAEAALR